jgi:site-specific DNA-methyltransferase (adenine-specific)
MTPYYDDGGVTIYHADCHAILPSIDPASVGLLLTDPPYGLGYTAQARGSVQGRLEGEKVIGDAEPFDPTHLLAYPRSVIFGGNYMTDVLPPSGWVIWSKVQDNRWSHGRYSTRSLAEMAWTNIHKYVALYNCFWAGSPMHRMGEERGSQLHPTQKPVALMRWIVDRYTEPGDLVLDPYMGSGPVARACKDTGRRYIGIEIEERYCQTAVKRLAQEVLDFT